MKGRLCQTAISYTIFDRTIPFLILFHGERQKIGSRVNIIHRRKVVSDAALKVFASVGRIVFQLLIWLAVFDAILADISVIINAAANEPGRANPAAGGAGTNVNILKIQAFALITRRADMHTRVLVAPAALAGQIPAKAAPEYIRIEPGRFPAVRTRPASHFHLYLPLKTG
jgi:hypothetical protein